MGNQAKITYLFHSGFAVETTNHLFIFDYYQPGPAKGGTLADGIVTAAYLQTKAGVFVFASHSHGDHYDPAILEWAKANPAITYVLSSDIRIGAKPPATHIMSPYEEWQQGGVTVQTFGSTDAGVSFLVQADGLAIFHAGDLNWWHWTGETKAERDWADDFFKQEMAKIGRPAIDIAFFPVDPRLGECYSMGAEYFAAELRPKLLIPMHFGSDFAITKAFAAKVKNSSLTTVAITHRGQEIFF